MGNIALYDVYIVRQDWLSIQDRHRIHYEERCWKATIHDAYNTNSYKLDVGYRGQDKTSVLYLSTTAAVIDLSSAHNLLPSVHHLYGVRPISPMMYRLRMLASTIRPHTRTGATAPASREARGLPETNLGAHVQAREWPKVCGPHTHAHARPSQLQWRSSSATVPANPLRPVPT